jgi:ketosteroid isomerase-like protein
MAEGDIFWLGGLDFEVESLEREDDLLLINGGNENNGFTLRAYDEDNGWKVVMDDDYHTYTNRGETALPLDENVTFTDGWDGGKTTVTGAEAVTEAIASTEMDYFSPLNTTVRVENGKIVEITRVYLSILDEATGKIITPNNPEIDIEALADGIYPVAFEFDGLADGDLTFTVYWEDSFDIVEINELAAGDTLYVNDTVVEVETVEEDDGDLLINGGLDNGGVTLRAYDEDNVWKAVLEDDMHTYFNWGETTLPLADDVTFTDGWDIEKEPVTVTGAEAVAEAIAGTEMDAFIPQNTTVRVEDGKIVEIIREYMP